MHEAAHATGHKSRLSRDLSGRKDSTSYAKKELRAEISSAFVSLDIGFNPSEEDIDNHKAYLQSWIHVLEENPDELFTAIKDAQKISDYLINKGEFQVIQPLIVNEHSQSPENSPNFFKKGSLDEINGSGKKNQNTDKLQPSNPILQSDNNAMKNVATNYILQQQENRSINAIDQ